ncbi:acyl-CoA thioesterase II [Parvularcula sp. ZS-1/3]|uniref:Acyl-CoA thioesterase 2 n=1 Tax=Parvularcula mediterranea TaxID=2732508 RepID=A0A7Y3W5M5_9PROT|nr:acyl-CoA thioesterase II [Parvularcula mediterranea]NNU16779.1 acyl-CoA thioesterase II [Parvularcula mediterranea]
MTPAESLLQLLDLETLDLNLFRGARDPEAKGRVFGGQVVAQALAAAAQTVSEDRRAHSLHAYFVRPGNDALPIIYRVERDRDGGSFSNRRVIAQQNGEPILNMITSFHKPEEGLSHQDEMPDVPGPEELRSDSEIAPELTHLPEGFRNFMARERGVELKRVNLDPLYGRKTEPTQHMWFRLTAPPPDPAIAGRAVLAYASDFALLGTSMLPHGLHWTYKGLKSASIDHAVWFHSDPQVGDWHLYTMDSGWSGGARGFARGRIFNQSGDLVASTAQEGLIRYKPEKEG